MVFQQAEAGRLPVDQPKPHFGVRRRQMTQRRLVRVMGTAVGATIVFRMDLRVGLLKGATLQLNQLICLRQPELFQSDHVSSAPPGGSQRFLFATWSRR